MTDYDPRTATGIPTEPVGSLPRPSWLQQAYAQYDAGQITRDQLEAEQDKAVRETIAEFEATGSPVVTDGEQRKPSFATYPLHGLDSLAPEGVVIPFADGHTRQLPVLTKGPFRYATHAASYLRSAQEVASRPVKQAVISASALSLVYPGDGLDGYSQEEFLGDLIDEAVQAAGERDRQARPGRRQLDLRAAVREMRAARRGFRDIRDDLFG